MRLYIVKATTESAEKYVEEILRSMRKEDGVEVEIPRRRPSRAKATGQGTLPTENP